MLVKNRAWIAYVFVALGLFYATFLLFSGGTLQKVTSADWPHFGSGAGTTEKLDTDPSAPTNNNDPDIIDPSLTLASSVLSVHPSPTTGLSGAAPSSSSHLADATPTLAIATFLTGQATDDTYFNSTRLLAYQLLHDAETRIENPSLTFVVLCGKKLPEAKRELLRKDGATVIPLEDVPLPSWIHTGVSRWSEQFTKLRVWELTQYSRVLYIDADYLIMHRMDAIFEEDIVTQRTPTMEFREESVFEDEGPLPGQYLFAGRSENGGQGGFEHFVPPVPTNYANGGFFMIAPQQDMFDHFLDVMQLEGRFSTQFMEQDMLNYIFRREGPMPWRELNWKWSSNFANQADVDGGVHSLHGKFWKEGPESVQQRWQNVMKKMLEWEKTRG